jgi:hypothetical protein
MKIISLSSSIAGPACAVAKSIKKYFYNNDYQTNMFDYLEISFLSILQILYLENDDINYLNLNNEIYLNKNDFNSVKFTNFDKIISHHDLKKIYSEDDYKNFIDKYKRRYYRLINDIKTEDKIFFIRYGIENNNIINEFINKILIINPNLKIFFIIIDYNEKHCDYNDKNYIYVNFYNHNKNIQYDNDLFYKTIQYDWKVVYDIIFNNLNSSEKENFKYFHY